MFCPKCGAQVPDEARFCSACCAPLGVQAPPVSEPVPAAEPVVTPNPAPVSVPTPPPAPVTVAPAKPVKKGNLISNLSDPKLRVLAIIALVIWLGALAVTVVSYFVAANSPIVDLPVVATAGKLAGEELELDEQAMEDLADEIAKVKKTMKDDLSGLNSKDYKKVEKLVNAAEDVLKDPTLGNLQTVLPLLNDVLAVMDANKEYFEEEFTDEAQQDLTEALEDMQEINDLVWFLNLIPYILFGFLGLCLLFTLLGGLFKLNGLLVVGMLFTALFTVIFAGIPYLALACGLHIVLMVFNGLLNKPYRQYKKELNCA